MCNLDLFYKRTKKLSFFSVTCPTNAYVMHLSAYYCYSLFSFFHVFTILILYLHSVLICKMIRT